MFIYFIFRLTIVEFAHVESKISRVNFRAVKPAQQLTELMARKVRRAPRERRGEARIGLAEFVVCSVEATYFAHES